MSEERWYYLHESRQVGPCSESDLHALLAKGEISLNTSVWSRNTNGWRTLRELSEQPVVSIRQSRLKWAILAIAMCGITAVASELLPKIGDGRKSPGSIENRNQNAATGATSKSGATRMPNTTVAATPSQVGSSTRAVLSGEMRLEMEFWRSIEGSNDADLYEIYLYRARPRMKQYGDVLSLIRQHQAIVFVDADAASAGTARAGT
jgi:hypothetical protein